LRKNLVEFLLGDRQGLTIVGPATIVKEIKQDPDKIQLFTQGGFPKKKEIDVKCNSKRLSENLKQPIFLVNFIIILLLIV